MKDEISESNKGQFSKDEYLTHGDVPTAKTGRLIQTPCFKLL